MSTTHASPLPRITPIGLWMFDATDGALRGPAGDRKIEDRAARTLALLCAHRGEIVSQARILDTVWHGRHVSPNSVAVVIADLRRALGDDAREPEFIETVAKRGYRLKGAPRSAPVESQRPRRRPLYRSLIYMAAAIALVGAVTGFARWVEPGRADLRIAVEPVRNETGIGRYGPLASAMSELLVNRIATFEAVDVYRQAAATPIGTPVPGLVVQSRLILWNGLPTLSMTGEDGGGHVVWTGMVEGPPDTLARKTITELTGLQNRLRARVLNAAAGARP
jgi:DNA-binding winged helix-turn-helix (wHTH) protein